MASNAKHEWDTVARVRLDELEHVYRRVRGDGTEQLVRSLYLLLVAQFQIYCRDLHDEAVGVHVAAANPRQAQLLGELLVKGRKLEVQNPQPAALGSDFGRFGFGLIRALKACGPETAGAVRSLELLVRFRNAVAHGDEAKVRELCESGEVAVRYRRYRQFRRITCHLVATMDSVVAAKLAGVLQIPPPW